MNTYDLHAALRDGTLAQLPSDAVTPAGLMARNAAGNTPLHVAAKAGRLRDLPAGLLDALCPIEP